MNTKPDLSSLFSFPQKAVKVFILVVLVIWIIKSIAIFVPPGHVGVVYDLGRGILPRVMHEGLNLAIPFWQRVTLLDIRLQEYTMSVVPDEGALRRDDSLDAPTSDGQQVKVDATVIFRLNPDKASEVLKKIGPDYIDKLIRPFTRSQIRMVISRYTAPAIYSEKRQEAEAAMTRELTQMLAPKDIIIDKVLLRSVNFSADYSQAIENKMIAEQKVKQAEYEVKEATQRAQAKIAEAKGLAEAQALQKATLTDEYLKYEAIKKWNGAMPQVVSGEGQIFNIPVR